MSDLADDLFETAPDNIFARIARQHAGGEAEARHRRLTEAVGAAIPFVGTAGLTVETLTPGEVVVALAPGRAVENHVGGLHAGAMTLLAETATGLVVAQNVPAESAPVLRSLAVDFQRRAEGTLRAVARLPEEEVRRIRARPIGKTEASVDVTGGDGREPIRATLRWAWLPKRRMGME